MIIKKEFNDRELRFLKRYTEREIKKIQAERLINDINIDNTDYDDLRIIYQKCDKILQERERFKNQNE
jgi:hypothetical protein